MRSGRLRSLLAPALCALVAFGFLCSLGVWQLHRLAWKEALIAHVAVRVDAPPVAVPAEADWSKINAEADEYRHVRLAGTFRHDLEVLCYALLSDPKGKFSGPGYWVLTPLETVDGATVLVNRGFVPLDRGDREARAANETQGTVTITGLLRMPERRSWFTPADDPPHRLWQVRDPEAIAAASGLRHVAPFFVDADTSPNASELPQAGETRLVFSNRHLEYAITWFGLALALLAVFAAFVRKQLR